MSGKHRRSLRCRIGWHKQPYVRLPSSCFNPKARCTRCQYVGLIDSNGCLF